MNTKYDANKNIEYNEEREPSNKGKNLIYQMVPIVSDGHSGCGFIRIKKKDNPKELTDLLKAKK